MVLYLKSVADHLAMGKIRQAHYEVPFTFQKMCFAYLNNDWVMAISSLFTLAATVALVVIDIPLHLVRSES